MDVNEAAVKAVANELAKGHQVLALVANVSSEAEVASVVAEVAAAFGRLDAAFNNAGIMMPPLKTADTDNATFDRIVAVNLAGVWNCLRHEIRQMRHRAVRHDRQQLLDCRPAQRLRAVRLHRHQARRRRPHQLHSAGRRAQGIRVNAVCPGTITTAIPRLGRAAEVAEAVLWLCSTSASYITGVALPVDGGLAAG